MAVARLVGVAFPVAIVLLLLGALRALIGVALGAERFAGGLGPAVQSLAALWLAVTFGLLVARRLSAADRQRTRQPRAGGRMTRRENRVYWLLLPSALAATALVDARLTGHAMAPAVGSALIVTALLTLAAFGIFAWRDRPARTG